MLSVLTFQKLKKSVHDPQKIVETTSINHIFKPWCNFLDEKSRQKVRKTSENRRSFRNLEIGQQTLSLCSSALARPKLEGTASCRFSLDYEEIPGSFLSQEKDPGWVWSRGTHILSVQQTKQMWKMCLRLILVHILPCVARTILCFRQVQFLYLLPPRIWVARDQTQPGFFFWERKEPGNEVSLHYEQSLFFVLTPPPPHLFLDNEDIF